MRTTIEEYKASIHADRTYVDRHIVDKKAPEPPLAGPPRVEQQTFLARRGPRLGALLAVLLALWGVFGLAAPAQAQEGCTGVACVTSGSEVVELDSTQSPVLNAILTSLLGEGATINLSAGDYNALLGADVQLGALLTQLQADLGVDSPGEVLTADMTLGQLLSAMAAVTNDPTAEVILNNLGLTVDSLTATLRLGDLLQIETGPGTVSDIDLNLFELVVGSIQLFNSANAVDVSDGITISGADIGLGDVLNEITLRATVVEAPVIVCGPAGSEFNSAAVRIALHVDLVDLSDVDSIDLLLLNIEVEATVSQLDLYLDIGRGQGVIQSIDVLTAAAAVDIEATPGVVGLYLGSIDDAIFFNRQATISPADVDYGVIGGVTLTATPLVGDPTVVGVDIEARSVATGDGPTELLQFTGPYPRTLSTAAGSGAIGALISTLITNLDIQIELEDDLFGLGGLVSDLLSFVFSLVDPLLDELLVDNQILEALLTSVLDPVLDVLGLSIGKMTVTVLGVEALCPALTVNITEVGDFAAGGQGTYHVDVTNVGTGEAEGPITIVVTLPDEFDFNNSSGDGWSDPVQDGQQLTFTHPGPLPPGDSLPTLVVVVDIPITASGTVETTVEADTPGNQGGDDSTETIETTIVPATPQELCEQAGICPSLTIQKSHAGNFVAGGQGVYTIRVTNDGLAATIGAITVVDTLPAGLTYASHTGSNWQVQVQGQTLTFTHPGPVAAGASLPDLRLTVNISAEASDTVTNSVTVDTPGNIGGEDSEDEDPTVIVQPDEEDLCAVHQICPSLTIQKSHQGNFVAGGQGVYTIRVTNDGGAATTGAITVIDTLPAGLTYASHTGSGWQVQQQGQTLTFTHPGPVAAGASLPDLRLTVTISADASGTVTNSVTVDTPENIGGEDSEDQDPTVIVPPGDPEALCLEHQVCPALHLEKRAVGTFLAGHTGQYRFTVTNEGGGATFGDIVLTDTLPDGLSYQSHSGSGWSVSSQNGQTVEMTHAGPLGPGESLPALILIVSIEAGMEGEVTNTATVETPGGFGGADTDSDTIQVSLSTVYYIPTLHREVSSDTPQ